MTNTHNTPGPNVPGGDAPPNRPPPSPPPHDVAELPGSIPDPPSQPNTESAQDTSPQRPGTKPEGSTYASSYRPSETQNPPPTTGPNQRFQYDASQFNDSVAEHPDHPHPDQPPPAYTEQPGRISEDNNELGTQAEVAPDGRVNIRINQKTRRISQLLIPQIQHQISIVEREPAPPPPYVPEFLGGAPGQEPPPPLNVVIHVVGSRGDVQPFVALGKVLKETYNHRVRLATHPVFKDFVTENGLEFFSIGGDPAELMAFMVKNPGLMPGFDTLRSGDVGKRRKGIGEIIRGTWRSCIETGDGLGIDPLKQTVEEWMNIESEMPEALTKPFVADAIIANPPSFGHIHCAEKLGIPIHMMFTMPWSPTQQFPHPLANIQSSNADASITNFISYTLVDMLTWQGLGDIINKFRKDSLGLDPISMIWAPGMLARMKIPYTYCWSPALIPKPKDWAHHISVSGFYFLDLAQNYTPAPDLAAFLADGEPPVYIGFGSIVVDDPNAMTTMIFEAVKKTGRRALVSKGWGGLGADELGIPEGVFMLGNCPHDWLFKHVSAVVHHGGAGTTAAGIAAGRPTVVVPFFGDQQFWGAMVAKAGAGPLPIPYKDLTAEKLAEAITCALKPESLERAKELSQRISKEEGAQTGAQSFHQMLKCEELRCSVQPKQPAVWRLKRTQVRLSAMAATVLAQEGELNFSELKLFRPREYETDEGPWDPITGGATALIGTMSTMAMGIADFPIETLKLLNIHPDNKKGKEPAKERKDSEASSVRTGRLPNSRTTTHTQGSASEASSSRSNVNEHSTAPTGTISPRSSTSSELTRVGTPGTPTSRGTFMAQAMAASTQVSRSSSRDRSRSRLERSRTISAAELRSETGSTFQDRMRGMNTDAAISTGKGIGRIVEAGFKSPMDFTLNVAKGFHNVPKLYGGEVRQVDKVTDMQSGVRTGLKELGLGFYEGISGLVTDPYKGAKKEGAAGFVKGVGRGIAGVPLRVMGGVFALPGYAMKGLYQEAMKSKGADVQNYIIAARISQGYDKAATISEGERKDILERWRCIKLNVKKKKNPGEESIETITTFMNDRRKKRLDRWAKLKGKHNVKPDAQPAFPPAIVRQDSYPDQPEVAPSRTTAAPNVSAALGQAFSNPGTGVQREGHPLQHANTFPRPSSSGAPISMVDNDDEDDDDRQQLEAAIAASVNETSRGNPDEDEMIARAIRASMAELQQPQPAGESEEEALQRAMRASIEEASRSGASEEEQKVLEEVLKNSMLEQRRVHGQHDYGTDSEWDSDSEEDEEYQRVIAESKELAHLQSTNLPAYVEHTAGGAQESGLVGDAGDRGIDEEAFKKALEESEKAERERMAEIERQKTEEEIVMEYVRKQSLAEEEHRRMAMQGRGEEVKKGESSGAGGS
ncbi:glycosyltransferase family 1 protein [Amniculicola lignicola CBS 123094]|uniref:Glycosyltransferase family 1 protein n=1 Tax=Amniculicola lignicola CBS 123094 TaxID=1392246 RepID=A0A6A5X2W2_9PLEO|nr:glycosyltransferase family 1 protein [Amniculicola lignicola CBS 123094]